MPWSLLVSLFKDLIIATFFHYEFNFNENTIVFLICIFINTVGIIFYLENHNKK